MKTCRDCAFIDAPRDRLGRVNLRTGYAYKCTVPVEPPVLPASVTDYPSFRWPPPRSHVTVDRLHDCPLHVLRAKK